MDNELNQVSNEGDVTTDPALMNVLNLLEKHTRLRLDVSKFSGDVTEWPGWWANFKEQIWNKPSYSATYKVVKLKELLPKDEAETLPITDYENPNLDQVEAYLKIQYESAFRLQHKIQDLISKLPQLPQYPASSEWKAVSKVALLLEQAAVNISPMIVDQLRDQLMFRLPTQECRQVMKPEFKEVAKFRKFAEENYFLALETERRKAIALPTYTRPTNPPIGRRANTISSDACPLCHGMHKFPQCPTLTTIPPQQRHQLFLAFGMCLRCGEHKYRREQPCERVCANCRRSHATVLCRVQRESNPTANPVETNPTSQPGRPFGQQSQDLNQ